MAVGNTLRLYESHARFPARGLYSQGWVRVTSVPTACISATPGIERTETYPTFENPVPLSQMMGARRDMVEVLQRARRGLL